MSRIAGDEEEAWGSAPFELAVEQSGHAVDHYEDTKHVYA